MNTTPTTKSATELYEVIHCCTDSDDYDIYSFIGIFSSEEKALRAVEKLKRTTYYSLHPDDFIVQKTALNRRAWIDGFDRY